jgi:glycosyltransferase involved in cell wall biosynthesis
MELSIIIPTREEQDAIVATLTQFKDLQLSHEVIVADGGSVDETVIRATPYADKVVVFHDEERTAGKSRNRGAAVAQGTYLAFIDAGVRIPDSNAFFTQALSHFKNDPTLVGVAVGQKVPKDKRTFGDRVSFALLNTLLRLSNNVLGIGEASGKGMIVSRDAYMKVGGFREDLHTREDGDFFARIRKLGRTYYDPTLFVYHDARRAHAIGWIRLWGIWTINSVWFLLTGKVVAKDWKPFR